MVDYENPYQKKVVAPSNVFCFITQIKTTLLKKLGIIFIKKKWGRQDPRNATKTPPRTKHLFRLNVMMNLLEIRLQLHQDLFTTLHSSWVVFL